MMFKINIVILSALIGLAGAIEETGSETIVSQVSEPNLDLIIDGDHFQGQYFSPDMTGERYGQERREHDLKLVGAFGEFAKSFLHDVVIRNSGSLYLSRHIVSLTKLMANYLPDFMRLVKASGPVSRHGFIRESMNTWPETMKLIDQGQVSSERMPKSNEQFMRDFEESLVTLKKLVKGNPCGIYVDWNKLLVNDETLAERLSPYVAYLQKTGHGTAISVLDKMVRLLSKVNSGQEA